MKDNQSVAKKLLQIEENLAHSIGDKLDQNKGIFKGLALGGLGIAAMSDPDTAQHVKDAFSGTADNISTAYHNATGTVGAADAVGTSGASNVSGASNGGDDVQSMINKLNPQPNSDAFAKIDELTKQGRLKEAEELKQALQKRMSDTSVDAFDYNSEKGQLSLNPSKIGGIAAGTAALGGAGYGLSKLLSNRMRKK